jgi:translation initiation factor IF-3
MMSAVTPNPKKRSFLLPKGYKDLIDLLKPKAKVKNLTIPPFRVNGRIRASMVDVRDAEGKAVGIMGLHDALELAKSRGLDLVEVDDMQPRSICLIIDYGAFRFQVSQGKKSGMKW